MCKKPVTLTVVIVPLDPPNPVQDARLVIDVGWVDSGADSLLLTTCSGPTSSLNVHTPTTFLSHFVPNTIASLISLST
jgi:hypothetical protein